MFLEGIWRTGGRGGGDKDLYMRISMNWAVNSLQGLDVEQSPNAQDAFRPIPGLFSCAGVTGSVGVLRHARITQMAGLIESSMLGSHR